VVGMNTWVAVGRRKIRDAVSEKIRKFSRYDENGSGTKPKSYSFGIRIVRQGYEDDHRPPSSVKITNDWSNVSTFPQAVIK
jgi:hypothetical protein